MPTESVILRETAGGDVLRGPPTRKRSGPQFVIAVVVQRKWLLANPALVPQEVSNATEGMDLEHATREVMFFEWNEGRGPLKLHRGPLSGTIWLKATAGGGPEYNFPSTLLSGDR